ncbi:MAG: TMEM165/GDT1 family protein, partial [Bdellovibrionota bacterium]
MAKILFTLPRAQTYTPLITLSYKFAETGPSINILTEDTPRISFVATTRRIMDAVLNSFILVFIGEMGDKTQLLSLVLVSKFKRPWTILLGVLIATIANHALAAWVGVLIGNSVPGEVLRW